MRFFQLALLFYGLLTIGLAADPQSLGNATINPSLSERSAKITQCLVTPKDGSDKKTIAKIDNYLRTIIRKDRVPSFTDESRGQFMWWVVNLDEGQLKEVQSRKDIAYAGAALEGSSSGIMRQDQNDTSSFDRRPGSLPMRANKRNSEWDYTLEAVDDLAQISIPPGKTDPFDYFNYIFDQTAGQEIYIYNIDSVRMIAHFYEHS